MHDLSFSLSQNLPGRPEQVCNKPTSPFLRSKHPFSSLPIHCYDRHCRFHHHLHRFPNIVIYFEFIVNKWVFFKRNDHSEYKLRKKKEGQSNHIQQNVVEMLQKSSIYKTQKTLEDKPDRISRLPDSLLLQILSHLGVEHVIQSSLLSKRWRYLWRTMAYLDFGCLERFPVSKKATFIDRYLFHHDGSKVCKLFINMEYEEDFDLLVDSWISFALRCKTEEFTLDFLDAHLQEDNIWENTFYKLPHGLFKFGSLKYLKLCACDLNVPTKIKFNSLKKLCFEYVDLDPCVIDRITSSSPLLEDLILIDCNKFIDLDIQITNVNVKKLEIREFGDHSLHNGIITIHAPSLISLLFFYCLPRTKYHVNNLQSLMLASLINVNEDDMKGALYDDDTHFGLTTLLHDLRHARELSLSDLCIQALSIKEMRKLDPVLINAQCVKVYLGVTKWELPGIAYLLRSAHNVETLKISFCCHWKINKPNTDFMEKYDFDEKGYWKQQEVDLSSTLLKIKTIVIGGFQRCHDVWEEPDFEQCLENEMEFVQFLLKNSKVLENMEIATNWETKDVERMFMLRQTLTGFPRASPNARLFII